LSLLTTPVLGFAAFSGTGKTTLLCRVIPLLRSRGLRLGLLKHSHHAFEVDQSGKDSFRLRHAGARQLVLASARRTVVMARHEPAAAPCLEDFLQRLELCKLDLILVEGYKYAALAKIELHRPELGHPLLAPQDPAIIAVATDAPLAAAVQVPLLDLNDAAAIAGFILQQYPFLRYSDSASAG
jgi:molybdopterin-guanine dinucleotide biosynthesis protein MobB